MARQFLQRKTSRLEAALVAAGGFSIVGLAITHRLLWSGEMTVLLGSIAIIGFVFLLVELAFDIAARCSRLAEALLRRRLG
jgi:hypothetical protein